MKGWTTTNNSAAVRLDPATEADSPTLANLLELYTHDLSAAFPNVELGADGRFGYPKLPLYWSEPERRSAFIVRYEGRIAGFAFTTLGSPATDDPDVSDVAEFFVIRRYRRMGVGRQAAQLLWKLRPGKWTVRVSESNSSGLSFWGRVVEEFAAGQSQILTRVDGSHTWRVFYFDVARSADD
jgi:predicted acetyltransferase